MHINKFRLKMAWERFWYWATADYLHKASFFYRIGAGFNSAKWYIIYPKGRFAEDNA